MGHLLESETISTREAAHIMGVTPSTVKRWADSGRLPSTRTPGGHRRFPRSAVRSHRAKAGEKNTRSQAWLTLLEGGADSYLIQATLLEERSRLGSWCRVADTVSAVFRELGEMWSAGEISIAQEHFATEQLRRALTACVTSMPNVPNAPVALLAAVDGDEHTIALSLLELAFREHGWSILWVGAPLPTEELLAAAVDRRVDLVAVSASVWSSDGEKLAAIHRRLISTCREHGIELICGGRGAWPDEVAYGRRLGSFEELHEHLTLRAR